MSYIPFAVQELKSLGFKSIDNSCSLGNSTVTFTPEEMTVKFPDRSISVLYSTMEEVLTLINEEPPSEQEVAAGFVQDALCIFENFTPYIQ